MVMVKQQNKQAKGVGKMNKAKGVLNVIGWACIFMVACIVGVGATEGAAWGIACFALVIVGMLINMVVELLPKAKRADRKPAFHTYKVTLRNIETGMVWDVTVQALDKDGLISRVRGQYETDYIKPVSAIRID